MSFTVWHVNFFVFVVQVEMNSTDEAAAADCKVSIFDSQMHVTDILQVNFTVQAIQPGQVSTLPLELTLILHCTTWFYSYRAGLFE